MDTYLHSLFTEPKFALEIILVCALYMIPLEKRSAGWKRRLETVLLVMFSVFIPIPPNAVFTYPLGCLLAFLFVRSVCSIDIPDSIFCVICAYATQHFAFSLYVLIFYPLNISEQLRRIGFFGNAVVIYLLFFLIFARRLPDKGHYHVDLKYSLTAYAVLIIFALFLSHISGEIYETEGGTLYYICRMYAMLCCVFLLWIQIAQKEKGIVQRKLELEQQISYSQREQYRESQKNIELINQKCHDLKHQIIAIRNMSSQKSREDTFSEIENVVQIYDSTIETGNDALNTVLMEKKLSCDHNGISMTCMADGSSMNFMDSIDIYTIFGNAMDNAIESVSQLEDQEKRFISITAHRISGLLIIRIENYCDHPITYRDGLPVTTKENTDYHGFGMRSIQMTAEKYGGCISVTTENQMFVLVLSIPVPVPVS